MPRKNSKRDAGQDDGLETHPGINVSAVEVEARLTHDIYSGVIPRAIEESDDDIKKEEPDISKMMIPLTALRMEIAELQRAGYKKIPLDYLLNIMHEVYKDDKDDQNAD